MTMKKLAIGLLCSLTTLMVGCTGELGGDSATGDDELVAESADAIINGTADAGHPYVAAVGWTLTKADGTKTPLICSGTLIAKRTVLTAGHCAKPAEPGQTFSNYNVYFGADRSAAGAKLYAATKAIPHPSYNPQVLGNYDVAVVLLAEDAPVAPIRVAQVITTMTNKPVTHVGFGTTVSTNSTTKSGAGTKKYAVTLPVTMQTAHMLRTGNGKSGICNGDSGGPALSTNATTKETFVVGVHSYIDDNEHCLGNGFSARTDIYFDFIHAYQ
jgi:secreted trypsin-like serine protease